MLRLGYRVAGTSYEGETGAVEDQELVAEQVAFYRARAPRYDEWWQRRGVYDKGADMAEEWRSQVGLVEEALGRFSVRGRVLELAGGTGW